MDWAQSQEPKDQKWLGPSHADEHRLGVSAELNYLDILKPLARCEFCSGRIQRRFPA